MPVYYPTLIAAGSEYCSAPTGNCHGSEISSAGSYPRAYQIHDQSGGAVRRLPDDARAQPGARASTTGSRAPPGRTRRSSTARPRPRTSTASSCSLYFNGAQAEPGRVAHAAGGLLDLEHADRRRSQPADGRDRRVADGLITAPAPATRRHPATPCTLGVSMSSATRTDRRDRHRLRRAGHRRRIRRARQRGVVRRHRRRQDRAASSAARSRSTSRASTSASRATASGCTSRPSWRRRSSTRGCCSSRSAPRRPTRATPTCRRSTRSSSRCRPRTATRW